MKKNFCYLLVFLFIIITINVLLNIETFINKLNNNVSNIDESVKGLYPTRNLENICKKKGGYPPSYMPTQCIHKDGTINRHANCECMDETLTYCTSCYPNIKHLELSAEDLENEYSYMNYNK